MKRSMLMTGCLMLTAALAVPAWGAPPFFEAWPSNVTGPPYATDLVEVTVFEDAAGANEIARLKSGLSDTDVVPAIGDKAPLRLESYGPGGAGGGYHIDSFFDVFTELSLGDMPGTLRVFHFFEAWPCSGGPAIDTATPGGMYHIDSFFDITYEIDFVDGSYLDLTISGTPGPGLLFADVGFEHSQPDSFFDITYDLTVDDFPLLDLDQPLVAMTMTGNYVPEPATLGLLALGGLALLKRKK